MVFWAFTNVCSHDNTWRLFDLEINDEVLYQEGHTRAVFDIDFQCDGALALTGLVASARGAITCLQRTRRLWARVGFTQWPLCHVPGRTSEGRAKCAVCSQWVSVGCSGSKLRLSQLHMCHRQRGQYNQNMGCAYASMCVHDTRAHVACEHGQISTTTWSLYLVVVV
jgi:hypothetical protein